MTDEDVVITGAGIVSSLGGTLDDVWGALLASQSGIRPVEDFPAGGPEGRVTAQISGLDPADLGVHHRDARIMGRHSWMLMKSARDACRWAGLDTRALPGEEIGFFAGMGMVDYRIEDLLPALLGSLSPDGGIDYDRFFETGYREIHPLWPLAMLNNISFCQTAIGLGITGENVVFSPHAESGALAIAEGARAVCEGRARFVLAGGVSEVVSPLSIARAEISGIGTILGEGCGIVCLESRSAARERGASYSTMVMGYGSSCGKEDRAACPSVGAIVQAMRQALDMAGLRPGDIGLIIAHGDGTVRGDANEAGAIRALFADPDSPAVYASKAALGNCLAAGPALDVIIGTRMIESGVIPGKILINAFSPEGQVACLVIGAAG